MHWLFKIYWGLRLCYVLDKNQVQQDWLFAVWTTNLWGWTEAELLKYLFCSAMWLELFNMQKKLSHVFHEVEHQG